MRKIITNFNNYHRDITAATKSLREAIRPCTPSIFPAAHVVSPDYTLENPPQRHSGTTEKFQSKGGDDFFQGLYISHDN